MAYYLLQIVPSYNEVAPHCGKSLSSVHSTILEMALQLLFVCRKFLSEIDVVVMEPVKVSYEGYTTFLDKTNKLKKGVYDYVL